MGSSVSIHNATNLILDVALCHIGPLYYENKVQPGGCFRRNVGKVWFTIKAKCYSGEKNVYTELFIGAPDVDYSLLGDAQRQGFLAGTEGFGTTVSFTGDGGGNEVLKSFPDGAAQLFDKLYVSSHGWYFGSDRTLYICGGPPASSVLRESYTCQHIVLDRDDLQPLYITEIPPEGFKAMCFGL